MDSELPPHVSFPDGPAGKPCPACEGEQGRRFYEVLGIPVHSCVLLSDQQAALDFPLGNLSLVHCPDCVFLYNDAFVSEALDYSADYEESQGASATFRQFLQTTAEDWVERAQLQSKVVLEVGCGRGDFLVQLLASGVGRAIGVDPSATAGGVPAPDGSPLELRRKYYDGAEFTLPIVVLAAHPGTPARSGPLCRNGARQPRSRRRKRPLHRSS